MPTGNFWDNHNDLKVKPVQQQPDAGYSGPAMSTNGGQPAAQTNGFPAATTNNQQATTNQPDAQTNDFPQVDPGAFNNSRDTVNTNRYEQGGVTGGNLGDYGNPADNAAGGGVNGNATTNLGDLAGGTPAQYNSINDAFGQNGGTLGSGTAGGNPAATTNNFDPHQQVGHDGTINGMTREQYRDAWQASGARSMDDLNAFIQAHGGTVQSGNGTVMTPFGESIDMLQGARTNGNGSAAWGGTGSGPGLEAGGSYVGPGQMTNTGAAPGGGGGGGYAGGGGGGTPAGSGQAPLPDYVGQAIDMPTDYTPAAVGGPDAWQAQQIAANQVTGPKALTAAQIAAMDPYRATTEADMLADPGYNVRLKNSLAALQQSAAAKGILRTGGTLQDLSAKAGEQTSAEFANVDARRRADYQFQAADRLNVGTANNAANATAYGLTNQYQQGAQVANQSANLQAAQANAANSLASWQAYQGMRTNTAQFNAARTDTANQQNFSNKFNVQNANNQNSLAAFQGNTNARLGYGSLDNQRTQTANSYSLGQGQLALGNRQADQSFQLGQGQLGLGYYNADTARQGQAGTQALGWAHYGLDADQQQFGQAYSVADMGLRAAGQYSNAAGNYGTNSGNNATSAGNAAAAGTVGGANAWNAGIGGAAGSAAQAYELWLASQRRAA